MIQLVQYFITQINDLTKNTILPRNYNLPLQLYVINSHRIISLFKSKIKIDIDRNFSLIPK